MSRVGKYPVSLPQGVACALNGQEVSVKGPKGELFYSLPSVLGLEVKEEKIFISPLSNLADSRRLWGTARSVVQNMVTGVFEGFSVLLEIEGVGYRASVQGKDLVLQVGYSHDINVPIPEGIQIKCDKPTQITVWGVNREQVGQVAANICAWREPEPYKGKGIRRAGRFVVRKEGKKK